MVKGVFWTFSVWRSQEHLDSFARSDPHRRIIERLRPRMSQTRFEFFPVSADNVPMTWEKRKASLR